MKSNYKRLGTYIEPANQLNDGMEVKELLGISNNKYFQNSHTNTIGIDLATYRIVRTGQFAYNRATTRNGDKISIALRKGDDCIVSPSYRIFKSKDENVLNSEYLMMWFRRSEFDRYARFKSHGSAHEFFEWEQMSDVELPIPSITKQREIVKEYNVIQNRMALNQQLIQKLEETAQAIYKQWFVDFEFPDENGKPYKSNGGELVWCEELQREIPMGWQVKNLGEVSKIIMGQSPEGESYNEEGIGIPLINGPVEFTIKTKWTTDPKKFCKKNDLIFCVRGSTVGKFVIADDRYAIGRGVCAINSTNPFFLMLIIRHNLSEILKDVTGSTFPNIDRKTLEAYQVILGDEELPNRFEKKLTQLNQYLKAKQQENQKLTELKDLLLSKLATVEN